MKEIRELTGLSQQRLADYLGVSRSQVALAETTERTLAGKALLRTHPMYKALQSKKAVPQVEQDKAEQTISLNRKLEKRKQKAAYLAAKAKRKLADLQKQYQQCCNALLMVNELRELVPATEEEATRNRLTLKLIETETMVKLKTCGLEVQGLLQLQIDVWEFEGGKVEGMMK